MTLQPPTSAQEKADWLRLIRSENVGPATFFDLMRHFGNAGDALEELPRIAARAGQRRPIKVATAQTVEREMERAHRLGASFHFLGGPGYPERLGAIHAPPPVILVRGDSAVMARAPLAIVGSRKASAAGKTLARNFAAAFVAAARTVVSGLALGIDAEAHRTALSAGTVAVVAGGVDRPTPEGHIELANEIVERGGAIVSEMPLGMVPLARDYPRRNRLIAGLCDGVVIIEAAARSGTLHTARYAFDENRDVYAVPGSPLDPRAAGSLQLLREGAAMAIEPRDVLDGVPVWEGAPEAPAGFSEETTEFHGSDDPLDTVAEALSLTPMGVDELVRITGMSVASVTAAVVELELAGRAERDVDGAVRATVGS
ncbi:MAG: DNA-processing protein DprA [Pseudomonadota bacterium]